ncbi:MAG: LCP family protein [Clostridiales bacterium]|nr:LCP family protein [Clostridiales bacterium]
MSWFRSHYTQIRNALIGLIMAAVAVFIWYGIGKYQERRAQEALYAAWTGQTAEAENVPGQELASDGSQTGESGQSGTEPALAEEKSAGTGTQETGTGDVTAGVATQEVSIGADTTEVSRQLYRAGLEQKAQLIHHEDGTVTWQDKTYRRSSYMKAILCMGIDRNDTMDGVRGFGETGQADGVFLIAQDTARNQIQVLMIPRDTMTAVRETDEDGNDLGLWLDHLTLAFGYGDGSTDSCERMVEAASDVLCGLEIDHYLAVDTAVIAELNDAVGGVTVTIPTDGMEKKDPEFVMGSQVTLRGSQAEAFVRYRDIERDHSAVYRMDQHREYIRQYFKTLQEKSKEDSGIVVRLFDMIQDYMITDMDKSQYLKIAVDSLNSGTLEDDSFYTLPGLGITTDTFDEYHVNFNQAIPMVLKLFYRETT